MIVFLATDHGGYYLKEELKSYLSDKGHRVVDMGNTAFDPDDDYTAFIFPLAEKVAKNKDSFGVVLGRSGVGESISANKVRGVRAALCVSEKMARKAREHNNANVIALGAEYVGATTAKRMVETFLKTPFSRAARHQRRVAAISSYEAKISK